MRTACLESDFVKTKVFYLFYDFFFFFKIKKCNKQEHIFQICQPISTFLVSGSQCIRAHLIFTLNRASIGCQRQRDNLFAKTWLLGLYLIHLIPGRPSHSTFHQTTVFLTLPRANGSWYFRVQGSEDSLHAKIYFLAT